MDINSLLSPSESPATETPPPMSSPSPRSSPVKRPGRPSTQQRKSSGLSQQLTLSPKPQEQSLPSFAAHNAAAVFQQNQQGAYGQASPSATYQHPVYAGASTPPTHLASMNESRTTPPQPTVHRQGSTPQMDTLADLASMQQQQHAARQNSVGTQSPQTLSYNLHNLSRPSLSARSSNEISMSEAPPQQPRIFVAASLSDDECQILYELGRHLTENPFDYEAHVRFINLLHQGFERHRESTSNADGYELLGELRQARQTMDRIFPLGEKLYLDWLKDEQILAKNIDDRIKIIEFFSRAVADEPSSASLWRMYGDYMYYLWSTTYEISTADSDGWSADEKEIGKEVFKWEPMMTVWEQGVTNTQRRLNDSNIVWDRYMEMLMQDQNKWPSSQKIQNIKIKYAERLSVAHATWEQTFQALASFLSTFDSAAYEETMVTMTQRGRGTKNAYSIREPQEIAIRKAVDSGDEAAEWTAYTEYLEWEVQKKGVFSFNLINGLYERATIRFPSVASLWNDYIEFLIENPSRDFSVLSVIERATRHCPWSGDLWSHRLLTMEAEGKEFSSIENTKHRATSTGLLDVGGMEELMKVYIAWCGCLRRRAFAPGAIEDELDIAEVAIRSALEHVRQIGEKNFGKEYAGDPHYRLERIHIKFLTQRGEVDAARQNWKALIAARKNSYDFWYRYYIWEMVIWAKFAMRATNEPETQLRTPDNATMVLHEALAHVSTMDWPEQCIQMYLNHCEQHESVHELRKAVIETRRVTKIVVKRREKEAADAAAAYQQQQQQQQQAAGTNVEETQTNGKRKRESETAGEEGIAKRQRPAELVRETGPSSTVTQPKRDREHTVIIVKNIPMNASELKIRQFFRDCGIINSIYLAQEKYTQAATIEFERQEDAMFAQTKSAKLFDGHELKITFGTGTTLWVTNYPPEADKQYIRELFKDCGEIIDIRLPSLKGNTRRRFCYVQFLNPDQAEKATQLDGKDLGGPYKLVAKVSDPVHKDDREGPIAEGREIFVRNVFWYAQEDDIKALFEPCGTIESVRIPRTMAGKSMGTAFVVFEDKASANNAVQRFDGTEYRKRQINVEISQPKANRGTRVIRNNTISPTPDAGSPSATSVEMNGYSEANGKNSKSRTIALLNVPDTVNAARIEKLLQPYGEIVKMNLRPDHAGAVVEFVEERSVAMAEMGLEGYELDGEKIRVGRVPELLKQKPHLKATKLADKLAEKKKEDEQKKHTQSIGPARLGSGVVSRPVQSNRGGRRGGLGFKRGGIGSSSRAEGEQPAGGKSNDYFKSLISKGKSEATEKQADGDQMET